MAYPAAVVSASDEASIRDQSKRHVLGHQVQASLPQWLRRALPSDHQEEFFAVTVCACPVHCHSLSQCCPNPTCARSLPWLTSHTRPGRCPYCGTWLGRILTPEHDAVAMARSIWTAATIGETLATTPAGIGASPGRSWMCSTWESQPLPEKTPQHLPEHSECRKPRSGNGSEGTFGHRCRRSCVCVRRLVSRSHNSSRRVV